MAQQGVQPHEEQEANGGHRPERRIRWDRVYRRRKLLEGMVEKFLEERGASQDQRRDSSCRNQEEQGGLEKVDPFRLRRFLFLDTSHGQV